MQQPDPCPACNKCVQPVTELQGDGRSMWEICPACSSRVDLLRSLMATGTDSAAPTKPLAVVRDITPARPAVAPKTSTLDILRAQANEIEARIQTPKQIAALRRQLKTLRATIAAFEEPSNG